MDINTEKGQITAQQELIAASLFEQSTGLRYMHTPKDKPALVDAVIIKDSVVVAVCETKCRQMTLQQFLDFHCEWLVTYEKVEKARQICTMLCVPFVGVLYLVPDNIVLYKRIANEDGSWACDITMRETETPKTVNGGKAIRQNAFINMINAKMIKGDSVGNGTQIR